MASMLHERMDHSRIMVHVQQVEESRKRKHTRNVHMVKDCPKNRGQTGGNS